MRKVLFALLVMCLLLMAACSTGAGTFITYHNNEIDKEILNDIETLDNEVINCIKNNNSDGLVEIFSEDLKKEAGDVEKLISKVIEPFKEKAFSHVDRYYSQVKKLGNYDFTIATFEDDPFYINITDAKSNDVFVSLIRSDSKVNDCLLSLIYIKEKNVWKLRNLSIGDYSVNNMTAIDFYEDAVSLESKGQKIPATLYMITANKLLRPAPFLQYKKENDIADYQKKLFENVSKEYVFPQKLSEHSGVEIYGFDIRILNEGAIPVIKYLTQIDENDGAGTEKEAREINKEVSNLYPGLNENFKILLYEAYYEPPIDSQKTYKCYRTVVE